MSGRIGIPVLPWENSSLPSIKLNQLITVLYRGIASSFRKHGTTKVKAFVTVLIVLSVFLFSIVVTIWKTRTKHGQATQGESIRHPTSRTLRPAKLVTICDDVLECIWCERLHSPIALQPGAGRPGHLSSGSLGYPGQ